MIVNAEHFFKKVQKTLFKLGYIWVDDTTEICSLKQAINNTDYNIVYLDISMDTFSLALYEHEKEGVSISHNLLKYMYVKE